MIRFLHDVVDLISCLDLENLKQFHEHVNLKKYIYQCKLLFIYLKCLLKIHSKYILEFFKTHIKLL